MEEMNLKGQVILAQIDVYLACKMFGRVHKLLKVLKNKVEDTSHKIHKDACNLILEFYSSERNLTKFLQIYNYMINNSITPNPQTYAAVFELIGQITDEQHQSGN